MTAAHNFVKYEWSEEEKKYVAYTAAEAYFFL